MSYHKSFAIALLFALAPLAACGINADASAEASRASAAPDADGSAVVPECVEAKYPCTWAEVPEEVRGKTYRIGALIADYLATADSIEEVVALLERTTGITDVASGELGIRFRVIGSRPILVALPNDSANPRLSSPLTTAPAKPHLVAGPGARTGVLPAVRAAMLPAIIQGGEPVGVTGKPDSAKQSLFLAPFAWEGNIFSGLAEPVPANQISVDLALMKGGYELAMKTSGGEDVGARERFSRQPVVAINEKQGQANVTLEHFKHWDDYSYVFLTTHGQTVSRGRVQMTYLYAGQATGEVMPNGLDPFLSSSAYQEALGEPGVEFSFSGRNGLNQAPGFLSSAEVQSCLLQDFVPKAEQYRDAAGELRASRSDRGFGPRCYTNVDPAVQIGLTTEFFRKYYPRGVTNTWIFLMACESMAVGDLGDVFTNNKRNKNVAVFGFDRPVSAHFVRPLAREFSRMVGAGYGVHDIVDSMRTVYKEDNFIGLILGKPGIISAKLTSGISNPSFAPDIVSLFDPASGHELVDGGSVGLVGEPGDGKPDSLRVVRQVALLGGRVPADAVKLRVEVKGRGAGSDLVPTQAGNAEEFYRVEPDASDLGFDVKEGERLDLTVVATLPGGGESRWTYRDISFAGCSWSLNVVGSSRAGKYGGSHATFMVMGERTTLSIGGTGFDGNIITVTFPTIAPGQSRTVDIGSKYSPSRAAAAFGFMGPDMETGDLGNLAQIMLNTGDGSSLRDRNGKVIDNYPPAARLQVTRSSGGVMTGRLLGKAWAHRTMQDERLVKPDVDLRFSAREWLSDVIKASETGRMPSFDQIAQEPCGGPSLFMGR